MQRASSTRPPAMSSLISVAHGGSILTMRRRHLTAPASAILAASSFESDRQKQPDVTTNASDAPAGAVGGKA